MLQNITARKNKKNWRFNDSNRLKRKDEKMEDLVESILDYVRSDYTDYAIMINGEWGSRKNIFLE